MRVCLVCEGSYPYVSGGVSSWVQMLCSEFKDVEFVIWSIATTKAEMSQYKYKLPDNVVEVKTVYIGENIEDKGGKHVKLSEKEKQTLRMLITSSYDQINWDDVFQLIQNNRENLYNIIMGTDFYNCCLDIYKKKNLFLVFHDFLWNMRGIYLPLVSALSGEIPSADIYHAVSTGFAGILASCASYIFKRPFLLSEHGIYTREREEDIIRSDWVTGEFKDIWIDFFKKLSAIAYHQAHLVTTLFESNMTLQQELGCPKDKLVIISNGIDFDQFYRQIPKDKAKKDWYDIGAVVRIVPIKDIKTMLVAFYQIKNAIPKARLHILGNYDENPEYYKECMELKNNLDLQDVIFYGQVNVRDYVDKIDLFLLTSISEGQPLAVLEGMAAGKPFICTNVGDCKSLIQGNHDEFGPAGYIVPAIDSEAIAEKVISLYKNPELLYQMGQNGQERVRKYYRKEIFLEQFKKIYNQMGEELYGRNRI